MLKLGELLELKEQEHKVMEPEPKAMEQLEFKELEHKAMEQVQLDNKAHGEQPEFKVQAPKDMVKDHTGPVDNKDKPLGGPVEPPEHKVLKVGELLAPKELELKDMDNQVNKDHGEPEFKVQLESKEPQEFKALEHKDWASEFKD